MLSLILGLVISAGQAEAGYCKSAAEIDAGVSSCEDNPLYATQAKLCLAELEREVKSTTATLAAAMQANQGGKQDKSLDSSKKDYRASEAALHQLLLRTQGTLREVEEYKKGVVFPEDFENDEVVGNDVEGFLRSEPCFNDTHDDLDAVLVKLREHEKNLLAARDISQNLKVGSATSQQKLEVDQRSGAQVLQKQVVKSGNDKGKQDSKSSVSGTERLDSKK